MEQSRHNRLFTWLCMVTAGLLLVFGIIFYNAAKVWEGKNTPISLEEISQRTGIAFPDNVYLINANLHQFLDPEITAKIVIDRANCKSPCLHDSSPPFLFQLA